MFVAHVRKTNQVGKVQARLLVLSDHAVYNCDLEAKKVKRRIPLAALALGNSENEASIATLVVALLGSKDNKQASAKAARAISRLARSHPSNQSAISQAGGIELLVGLLDVDEGGGTDFVKLGFVGRPKAGRAILWYNTWYNEATGTFTQEHRTMHEATPVLKGEKWAANKWIHTGEPPAVRRSSAGTRPMRANRGSRAPAPAR